MTLKMREIALGGKVEMNGLRCSVHEVIEFVGYLHFDSL